jgi:plastocyanin
VQGPAPAPPSVPHVQVTAIEYHFTLSRTTVPAGTVILDFVNHGQDEHNLNVAPEEGPQDGALANTPSEGMGELKIQLRAGTYTLFCSLPEHEKKGMKATLTVE